MNDQIENWNGLWLIKDDTHISQWVKAHKGLNCDPHLFKWLRPHLQKANTIWDVGAFIGDHTNVYLQYAATVVAIEPNPVAFACLSHNCSDAVCINKAASSVSGDEVHFVANPNAGASSIQGDEGLVVETLTLDELYSKPDFVKIDVEGFEKKTLLGMTRTLRECKPTIFIEINRGALARQDTNSDELVAILKENGYTKFEIYPPNATEADAQYDLLCR